MQVFVTINNVGTMINAYVNVKNWMTKEYVIREFIWNPSNCECVCDKSCDVGEYVDYVNCKCRKRLVDKLIEECTQNVEEAKITGINSFEYKDKCKSSCTIYVVLIAIVFKIWIGIGTYFVYYKYMNHSKKLLLNMIMSIKHQIININGKYQRNKH